MINNKQYRSKSFIILGENNLSIFKGSLLPIEKISPETIKQLLEKDQIEEVILKEEEKDISIEVSFTVVNENEPSIIEDKNNNNNGKRGKRKLNVNE